MKKWLTALCLVGIFALAGCQLPTTDSSQNSTPNSSSSDPITVHKHMDDNADGACDECNASVQTTLQFYSINDMHGKFEDTYYNMGVDEMTTYLRNAQTADENTVLLSAGDMWQGSAESNFTKGGIIVDWMNDLGFEAMTIGNHEFDWGEAFIQTNEKAAQFPFLGVNVYDKDTNQRVEYCQPSVMIERSGVKIGLIGAIGDCYSSIAEEQVQGVYFKVGNALTDLVKAESVKLRAQGADVIVYTVHDAEASNPSHYDVGLSDGYVDLVFEGHSHTVVNEKDAHGVWHLQAGGDNSVGLSHAKLTVNILTGKIEVNQAGIVNASVYQNLADDPIVDTLMAKYADQLTQTSQLLGYNEAYRDYDSLAAFAARSLFEAGIQRWGEDEKYKGRIVLGGGYLNVRSPYYLPQKDVIYGDIYTLFPFDNRVTLCEVRGNRLLQQFINSNNYYCYYGADGQAIKDNVNYNETYYVVVDTYCANYNFKNMGYLDIVEYYAEEDFFTRDAIALYIQAGGLGKQPQKLNATIAEILAIGEKLADNAETADKYTVTGTIVTDPTQPYGNYTIEDEQGDRLYVYGTYLADGTRYDKFTVKPVKGDTVTLEGKIKKYVNQNGDVTIELVNSVLKAHVAKEDPPIEDDDPIQPPVDPPADDPTDDPIQPPTDDPTTNNATIAEILAIGEKLADNAETAEKYTVTGTIVTTPAEPYGNYTIKDEQGDQLYIYGTYLADGTRYDKFTIKPNLGDTVTLEGSIKKYVNQNGVVTIEIINAVLKEHQAKTTVSEILAIGETLEDNAETADKYTVTGTIVTDPTLPYGNYTIEDEFGDQLYIYGTYLADGTRYDKFTVKPVKGDTVTLEGKIKKYVNKTGTVTIEIIDAVWKNSDNSSGETDGKEDGDDPVIETLLSVSLPDEFGGTGISKYNTGNYGSYTVDNYTIEYYRAYKSSTDCLFTLFPYVASPTDGSADGSIYNVSPIFGIKEISITYKSEKGSVLYTGDDRIAQMTAYSLPAATSFTTVKFSVDTDNFFKLDSGDGQLTVQALSVSYTGEVVAYHSQKANGGYGYNRLNAVTFKGTLVAGQSSVAVPVSVSFDGGAYTVLQTKTYTYYTLEYVEAHPDVADEAAMLTPKDVAAYYSAFKQFPANYAAKNCTGNKFSTVKATFGDDTRYVSKYDRTDGYAMYVPYTLENTTYYEFDIALDASYWEDGERGVGRVVAWENGWDSEGYDDSPVCVYTDDHYATFQEYMNTGAFGRRFDAERSLVFVRWTPPKTYSAS